MHQKWCLFLQLAAEKKDTIFGAARKTFGHSYFETALSQQNIKGLLEGKTTKRFLNHGRVFSFFSLSLSIFSKTKKKQYILTDSAMKIIHSYKCLMTENMLPIQRLTLL